MITEAISRVFFLLVQGALRPLLAVVPPMPGWAQDGFDAIGQVWAQLAFMDVWLPIDLAVTCCLFILGVYAITMGMEITRMILSFVTFGGGAK